MREARRFNVENEMLTVRDIIDSDRNVHDVQESVIRYRLKAGDRTLENLLRPAGTIAVKAKAPPKDVGPAQEVTYVSDGSTASYYELPPKATELQDLISYKDMNAQIGEIFRACYRYGEVNHSTKLRDAKKILFYAQAEIERLEGWLK